MQTLLQCTLSAVKGIFENRIRDMVSFELGREIEKDVFRLVISAGQRKNCESPWGIEPFSLCGSVVEHRSTEPEGLRFNSSWEFFLCPTLVTRRKTSFSKGILFWYAVLFSGLVSRETRYSLGELSFRLRETLAKILLHFTLFTMSSTKISLFCVVIVLLTNRFSFSMSSVGEKDMMVLGDFNLGPDLDMEGKSLI